MQYSDLVVKVGSMDYASQKFLLGALMGRLKDNKEFVNTVTEFVGMLNTEDKGSMVEEKALTPPKDFIKVPELFAKIKENPGKYALNYFTTSADFTTIKSVSVGNWNGPFQIKIELVGDGNKDVYTLYGALASIINESQWELRDSNHRYFMIKETNPFTKLTENFSNSNDGKMQSFSIDFEKDFKDADKPGVKVLTNKDLLEELLENSDFYGITRVQEVTSTLGIMLAEEDEVDGVPVVCLKITNAARSPFLLKLDGKALRYTDNSWLVREDRSNATQNNIYIVSKLKGARGDVLRGRKRDDRK